MKKPVIGNRRKGVRLCWTKLQSGALGAGVLALAHCLAAHKLIVRD